MQRLRLLRPVVLLGTGQDISGGQLNLGAPGRLQDAAQGGQQGRQRGRGVIPNEDLLDHGSGHIPLLKPHQVGHRPPPAGDHQLALAALALTTGSASAQTPVGPKQPFSGVVNGSTANATVYVLCLGPVHLGQFGRPFNDRWVVILGGFGFTGSAANRIVATISPPATAVSSTFTEYGVPQAFPPTLLLPCSGTGTAVFTPEPTSFTARAARVTVRFVNLAV